MRLKKLQVSGFKSFVDPTDIRLPSHLVGVVGPNGCGKSNVIDAVRWVMGESSARMLRGDNMADVIFNGSSARKPVGKASVELVFDNSEGRAGGNYARFAEISVKRTLTRDGISTYSINNIKTRRRDVLDLFRGTGLGPRSYSIIEQGMVSRIVEARPEDLRVFVEEAAGTSRYKDRRRETENRIRHTRENLDRVADIRDELGKQLRRLKRQSASARRYKTLKEEERRVAGELLHLKLGQLNGQLQDQDRLNAELENGFQKALSTQRQTESELEKLRRDQADAQERSSRIQQEFYEVSSSITRAEQQIEHFNERALRKDEEVQRLASEKSRKQKQIEYDARKKQELERALGEMTPELESLRQNCSQRESRLAEAERVVQEWSAEMEAFIEQSRAPAQQIEIQKSRAQHLERNLERAGRRQARLRERLAELEQGISAMDIESLKREVAERDREYEEAEQRVREIEERLRDGDRELRERQAELSDLKGALKETVSRLESLRQIQAAALDADDDSVDRWLSDTGLSGGSRILDDLQVDEGWRRAADRALNGFLRATCVDRLEAGMLRGRPDSALALVTPNPAAAPARRLDFPGLADKVRSASADLSGLLHGVYAMESLEQALAHRDQLQGREYMVTRDGDLVGVNWVSFASSSQLETGILVREDEIMRLETQRERARVECDAVQEAISGLERTRTGLEADLESRREIVNRLRSGVAELHGHLGREETRCQEARDQVRETSEELRVLDEQVAVERGELDNASTLLGAAREESGSLDEQKRRLVERKELLTRDVADNREAVAEAQRKLQDFEMEKNRREAEAASLDENMRRTRADLESSELRLRELSGETAAPGGDLDELKESLRGLMNGKLEIEERFNASRDEAAGFESRISEVNERRTREVEEVNAARENLDQKKLDRREILVRRDTLLETIQNQGYDVDECGAQLPEGAGVDEWQANLEEIERKVARIGPVNLVAIEEYEEESERMQYLDRQHADLSEALTTLESVIRKIDRETRTRFRETFDKLNKGFNEFFPRLFGGGKAELLLTSEDLLTAGVSVMARPPGKRNSHIHLLSGGEKALTAVALLFSLFKLNPAPFCMLDEVDAPLDDANVDRYCETLKTLADYSQMIVITHNKITMQAMDLLVGVTMAEAGVSRLVSVDVDRAVKLAASDVS